MSLLPTSPSMSLQGQVVMSQGQMVTAWADRAWSMDPELRMGLLPLIQNETLP